MDIDDLKARLKGWAAPGVRPNLNLEPRNQKGTYRLKGKLEPLPRRHVRITVTRWSGIMGYVLSLVIAATVLGATLAGSEEFDLGVDGVTVGTSLNNRDDTDRTAVIKEREWESPEMIAIIERNRDDRERKVVVDR